MSLHVWPYVIAYKPKFSSVEVFTPPHFSMSFKCTGTDVIKTDLETHFCCCNTSCCSIHLSVVKRFMLIDVHNSFNLRLVSSPQLKDSTFVSVYC